MLWVASSGLIYDMFSDTENIIEPEDIPYYDAVKWCVGVDFGTANTTVFSLMFKDSKGCIYVCKEWYFEGRAEAELNNNYDAQKTDLEYSEDAKTFIGENYHLTGLTYKDIIFVVDPAASSFKLQLRRRRFRTKNGNNEVLDGVRTVASYIGQRMLKISRECTLALQEIHTYSWDVKAQERNGKDVILKQNDHACLHGDTLVLTTDGYIPIKELVGREGYVVTINPDTGERVNKRFFDVRKTRVNADIIRVELENGDYVDLTKDHKVLTVDGWKDAGRLTLSDYVAAISEIKDAMQVMQIRKIPNADVYNMEVEDVHCFAVSKSNIIVHNCDAMRYGLMYLKDKNDISGAALNVGV